ncbi:hypothetical protein GDO78_021998 [Eleutherodactylus coqui]|uniref:Uncharacterized protein n=1 Tax=Eleutherodactylus coqui TaxID=57060 RepID=A0A8J6JS38_ELECQ|nr:hypothetical protein GDO78_021998 [Eleutherodactylus coqui]
MLTGLESDPWSSATVAEKQPPCHMQVDFYLFTLMLGGHIFTSWQRSAGVCDRSNRSVLRWFGNRVGLITHK